MLLFLGSHPALDFLNTRYGPHGQVVECIGDGRSLVDWLVGAGLVDAAGATKMKRRLGQEALDTASEEARRVREWARGWIARWAEAPTADYGRELVVLNGLLGRATSRREVVLSEGRLQLTESHRIESAEELLAMVALQIALLITNEEPALIKECASSACTLSFLDRTKSHRRLFCSATVCGNRAKVAAFRERQRKND
ncbi:CGNR zinc finger domain-containing protein [Pendulispora rubella]|uniref:CGNR zinc finger domain-containing protein n=1 Tax=Pendulispora rubella TaxID=2741070 RepID=A0ABZ2KP56_9BACT